MEEISQYDIFDVLRGLLKETSETFKAMVEESSEDSNEIPPPDDIFVPLPFRSETAADGTSISSPIDIPKAPKVKNWWQCNKHWVVPTVIAIVIAIIIIYFYRRKRKKEKDEEFRRWEGQHLPKIDYPRPSAASGPVIISEPAPATTSLLVEYFDELERVERAQKAQDLPKDPPKEAEVPPDHEEFKS